MNKATAGKDRAEGQPEQDQKDARWSWRDVLEIVVVALALAAVYSVFFLTARVPSGSMEQTVMTGDYVIATRMDRTDIKRYDIMVFIPPDEPDIIYIKRVIGLPGETITVSGGRVFAGEEELDDSFLPEEMNGNGDGVFQVPEGCYFMLGDNRNHSLDARFWQEKYVPEENMLAKAWFTIWPLNHIRSLRYQGNVAPAG